MGNRPKLGRSFADFRNVCIFALPMRLKINRMFPVYRRTAEPDRSGRRTEAEQKGTPGNRNYGLMAEWLGKGLQNLVQRFESASDLNLIPEDAVFQALRGFLFLRSPNWSPDGIITS